MIYQVKNGMYQDFQIKLNGLLLIMQNKGKSKKGIKYHP